MSDVTFRKFIPITIVITLVLIQGVLFIGCLLLTYFTYNCTPNSINLGMILFFNYFGGLSTFCFYCVAKIGIYIKLTGDKCDYEISSPNSLRTTNTSRFLSSSINWEETNLNSDVRATSTDVPDSTIDIKDFYTHLPPVISVASRFYYEAFTYGVLSALWIFTSVLALIGCFCRVSSKACFWILFVPWFFVVIFGSTCDIVATVFHINDIVHTRTLAKTLEHLGIENVDPLLRYDNYSIDYMYLPIVMTCLTTRLVILWLVNTFGAFLVIFQVRKIVFNGNVDQITNEFKFLEKNEYAGNHIKSDRDKQLSDSGRHDDSPKHYRLSKATTPDLLSTNDNLSGNVSRSNSKLSSQGHDGYRKQFNHGGQSPNIQNPRDSQIIPEDALSSMSSESELSRTQSIKDKVHLTEELRSQLPWSYLNASDIAKSIKILSHHEHHDVPPPVPVPDYRISAHRQQRTSMRGDGIVN